MKEHDPLPPNYSQAALGGFVLIGLVLCYLIAAPFVPALVWSVTLAVLFAPLETILRSRLRWPGLSVSVTLLLAAIMVVAPVIFVSRALIDTIAGSASEVDALFTDDWRSATQGYPGLSPLLVWIDNHFDAAQMVQSFSSRLQGWGARLVVGSLAGAINLLLTFYFLFYLLRDRKWILQALGRLMPLSGQEFIGFAERLKQTVFATVWGTAAVSALQGVLGGLMFWWLDLPSPVFWGIIMGLLAIVPFLGAFVIWVPAAVFLVVNGEWLSAAVLTIWGTLIVGLIDNVIYPVLVGRQLALHSLISFIAIIGGIAVFGAHGFVLGPLILAATLTLLEILRSRMDARTGNGEMTAQDTLPS
ncbi:AI-2E family transporter [Altererythrobacter sp. ZODW24]|uniref:AI-2E family transporter n=1 Tax=Altererythrobacter sp. ZODW24 TaxID=2185142 RepID=UPI000DF7E3FE|nr:AI-2E family transporter [Altererythrobacter sp. ZODW24]